MARPTDTATFNARAHRTLVEEMTARGEGVHDVGRQTYQRTGQLPKNVNVFGAVRTSRNAMVREGDVYRLLHGPKHPSVYFTDGTGSMGENVGKALLAMEATHAMLDGVRNTYHTDIAHGVVQDVSDTHPVLQMAEWESDERASAHVRELVPDMDGGDPEEDYDFAPAYLDRFTQIDLADFYGLKGIAVITGDQVGRGFVTAEAIQQHLGQSWQPQREPTQTICKRLLSRWHPFFVQVGRGGTRRNSVTSWWEERLGPNRVIVASNPDLLAETWAGITYITETAQPTRDGFLEFVTAGGSNRRTSRSEANEVWDWLRVAEPYFGAQTKLPGYDQLPKPGDVFANLRDPWPIGHPRFSENPAAEGDDTRVVVPSAASSPARQPAKKGNPIDWNKF